MLNPKTLLLFTARNLTRAGEPRIDPASFGQAIINVLPTSTWLEALQGQTMIHFEVLEAVFPNDGSTPEYFDRNDPDTFYVAEVLKIYQNYSSTKPEGVVQSMLNGNGRSVLSDIPVVRGGLKYRTSRFISDDPVAVKRLNEQRLSRVVSAAQTANNMRIFSVGRQPELAGDLNGMFASSFAQVKGLMAPLPVAKNGTFGTNGNALPAPVTTPPPAASTPAAEPTQDN